MSLLYQDPSMNHDEANTLLAAGNEADVIAALISIGLNEPDGVWAQNTCLHCLNSESENVASAAITALGHVARRHGQLEVEKVLAAFKLAKERFPSLEPVISDTLEDIELFT
ncbi:hypothetical protein ACIPIN_20095 [Pseudomonas sp. NPDC087697]|uniref:hypothetical protein n=1 Tax=Pseudomonas sp. NPDC087697 TaxID=3364447 RepID=UPI003816DB8E